MKVTAVRISLACLATIASSVSAATTPWVQTPLDREAVESVWVYIDAKDCAGAIRTLNQGVAKERPSVLLLAGAMFESGICLKPSWERAVDLYQRADAAGHPRAAARLASGYASPAGGPDRGAAIWWALRAAAPLPAACSSVVPQADKAEQFIAALSALPAALLDACVYVAGVTTTINGDAEFPRRAAMLGVQGEVSIVFEPARDVITLDTTSLDFIQHGGVTSGNAMIDRQSRSVRQEFETDLRAVADRALKRYPKPAGMPADWKVSMRFSFWFAT